MIAGVDVTCARESIIKAPFDGTLQYWRPMGGHPDRECLDKGVRIDGSGQWQGYFILIAYVQPFTFGKVKKGEDIGTSVQLSCDSARNTDFENYVQVRLYREGRAVDPTLHLHDCMCTGQLCESNPTNQLLSDSEKTSMSDSPAYNGVYGWKVQCPMMVDTEDSMGNVINPDNVVPRSPVIYSPISGKFIGRVRLQQNDEDEYSGCANDGIVIVGTDKWEDFEAKIYNARIFSHLTPGTVTVEQGEPIGNRLGCPTAPDTVFLEIRHHGRIIDVSEQLTATNCTTPQRYV